MHCWDVQLDDAMAEEVAPGCGGAAGLQSLLLRKQQSATAQANQQAVEEAVMAAVTGLAECPVPESMVKEMAQQEYQARLLNAQARVSAGSLHRGVVIAPGPTHMLLIAQCLALAAHTFLKSKPACLWWLANAVVLRSFRA